ncbi:hypothetical protein B0O99DRAFT_154077 [Bisporella sp. PMI_857]|nr:hypothetical protein B0O99DRAFT_154077 [Bisporella sp. PMI_857]
MARTKATARKTPAKTLMSWTRFYLPREQEWPTWSVNHDDVHAGPLVDVEGRGKLSLGRMVENPEQAVYIIEWATLDDLKNFQASPACVGFLQNLPEYDNSRVSMESGLTLRHLTLDDAPPPLPPTSSRFLTFHHATQARTSELQDRVTITTFLVPRKVDNVFRMWYDDFQDFKPSKFSVVWFWVLAEDHWVEKKFGKLEQTQEENQGRTIFSHFQIWAPKYSATSEQEEALAADPRARESWNQAIAQVMPPATAWERERWDISEIPRFYPPESDFEMDPEEVKYNEEQTKLLKEYFELHGLEYVDNRC